MEFIKNHSLILVLFAASIFTFLWLTRFRERLRMSRVATLAITILHVLYGVFCVRFFAFLESGAESGGFSKMSIYGAVFFMPFGYWLGSKLTKRKLADVFDIFTICTVFTLACSRVNCLVSGCCSGIQFFHTSLHWPTRELEIIYYLLFIILLAPRIIKSETHGEIYPLYMLTYGAVRFMLEFVRVSDSRWLLHVSHLWSFIALTLGFTIYTQMKSPTKGTQNHDRGK